MDKDRSKKVLYTFLLCAQRSLNLTISEQSLTLIHNFLPWYDKEEVLKLIESQWNTGKIKHNNGSDYLPYSTLTISQLVINGLTGSNLCCISFNSCGNQLMSPITPVDSSATCSMPNLRFKLPVRVVPDKADCSSLYIMIVPCVLYSGSHKPSIARFTAASLPINEYFGINTRLSINIGNMILSFHINHEISQGTMTRLSQLSLPTSPPSSPTTTLPGTPPTYSNSSSRSSSCNEREPRLKSIRSESRLVLPDSPILVY
eukprot:NODE_1331_length_2008_cov_24.061008_g1125_i0.p1 GENE.NODE_1331_length_2008_cov_24.061008_g1125_i0~~NODE_1331_length_2008_cov_24.061008_g1125_i0.p1  ORF type:complete len:274 (-),score=30.81 NODE_1331_length_2008_cov_24.061008_g1125_i0:1185-1961(-)